MRQLEKIVFIAGVEHSGTTLLEMMLGCHPQMLGLGEIWALLDADRWNRWIVDNTNPCSCGVMVHDCPLWGPTLARVRSRPDEPFADRYERLLDAALEAVPGTTVITDSSKHLIALEAVRQVCERRGVELAVVHVVKDVRSWLASMRAVYRVTNPITTYRSMARWLTLNRDFVGIVQNAAPPGMTVGYEELCFSHEEMLRRLCESVGLEFTSRMLDLGNSSGHIGGGNPMRHDDDKSAAVFYDNRWFFAPMISLLYLARPRVRAFNERVVYSNTWSEGQLGAISFSPVQRSQASGPEAG